MFLRNLSFYFRFHDLRTNREKFRLFFSQITLLGGSQEREYKISSQKRDHKTAFCSKFLEGIRNWILATKICYTEQTGF